jgi:hypothetical protein
VGGTERLYWRPCYFSRKGHEVPNLKAVVVVVRNSNWGDIAAIRDLLTPLQILKRLVLAIWLTFLSPPTISCQLSERRAKNYLSYGRTDKLFSHCWIYPRCSRIRILASYAVELRLIDLDSPAGHSVHAACDFHAAQRSHVNNALYGNNADLVFAMRWDFCCYFQVSFLSPSAI